MDRIMSAGFPFLVAAALAFVTDNSHLPLENSSRLTLNNAIANQTYSAAFNDAFSAFDDIYSIKIQDKGREIIIYCNTTYCYKNRNAPMSA